MLRVADIRDLKRGIEFSELKIGDTFLFNKELGIRMKQITTVDEKTFNVVFLTEDEGCVYGYLSDEDTVTPVSCVISIEE